MAQARIVLRNEHHAIAESIQEVTKLGSLTEVVGAMLSRYGRHMLETWELDPMRYNEPQPAIAPTPTLATFPDSPPIDSGEDLPPAEL